MNCSVDVRFLVEGYEIRNSRVLSGLAGTSLLCVRNFQKRDLFDTLHIFGRRLRGLQLAASQPHLQDFQLRPAALSSGYVLLDVMRFEKLCSDGGHDRRY